MPKPIPSGSRSTVRTTASRVVRSATNATSVRCSSSWLETGVTPRHTIAGNRFERPVTLYDDNNKAINGQETIRIGTSDY